MLLLLLSPGCGRSRSASTAAPKKAVKTAVDAGAAADGGRRDEDDLEASYTPRRSRVNEEDCDDVSREVLARLRAQGERLTRRGAELVERERALQARSEALMAQLRQAEARQAAAPAAPAREARERGQEEQVRTASLLVEGMPPVKAAALLAELRDAGLAAGVLRALPAEKAGRVLAQMRPEIAARLMERREGEPAAPERAQGPEKAADKAQGAERAHGPGPDRRDQGPDKGPGRGKDEAR